MTTAQVIVRFGQDRDYEFQVAPAMAPEAARAWLDEQFVALGAEPIRPSGKILIGDKVLSVAMAAGADRFANDRDWARAFAVASVSALQRAAVHVDVEHTTIGY